MRKVIEQNRGYVKDTATQAVVNSDNKSYLTYMKRIAQKRKESDKLREVVRDINILKTEMYEIKKLLKEVINK
jgi:hypothetical protein